MDLLLGEAAPGMHVLVGDRSILLIERRFVGQDWLTPPAAVPEEGAPPIATFWSHKGGVGRTTALAVAAAQMARQGKVILTVDLDLEAPGLGSILLGPTGLAPAPLPEDRTPRYGTLDWYVENGLQPLGEDFIDDLIGVSALGASRGRVDVVPALGKMSQVHPANVIAKLARAYVEDPGPAGSRPKTFLDQTRDLVHKLSRFRAYDAILIDARAGLNESAAAALLGLGADVLLFGLNTPQSMAGFRLLLAYMAGFLPATDISTDWRLRLKMIHAKASADPDDHRTFRDRSFEIFAEFLYEESSPYEPSIDSFNFDIDDPDAPHASWRILDDANFRDFDPLAKPELLDETYVTRTFDNFVNGLSGRLFPNGAQ
jgi:hypothetical protein